MQHRMSGKAIRAPLCSAGGAGGVLACLLSPLLAAGCTQGKLAELHTAADFDRYVVRSGRPVLVDFYKESCPTCVVQEAELEQLCDQYAGKVTFAKFKIRDPNMADSCPQIMARYKLFWVPTTILFVGGREKARWTLNHLAAEFRPALDAAAGRRPMYQPLPWQSFLEPGAKVANYPAPAPGQCVEGKGCRIAPPH